jgi:hypothetical protein
MRNAYKILAEKHEKRDHLEYQGVDGRKKSKCILGKQGWRVWIGFISLRKGTGGGLL